LAKLTINIGSFIQTQNRNGAFQGTRLDQAYLVKCDAETTTRQGIDKGQINVMIGFAPIEPEEFIIIKNQPKRRTTKPVEAKPKTSQRQPSKLFINSIFLKWASTFFEMFCTKAVATFILLPKTSKRRAPKLNSATKVILKL
jgi:hypothetical protein